MEFGRGVVEILGLQNSLKTISADVAGFKPSISSFAFVPINSLARHVLSQEHSSVSAASFFKSDV
jgi:hypothetical protein